MKFFILFFAMIAAAMPQNKPGAIIMPGIFSDNMVLQQKANVTFWGKASPGESVIINAGWGASVRTKADDKGNWKTKIKTIKAGGPYQVTLKIADSTIVYKNVLLGEVWVCSGQSNMEMPLQGWLPQCPIQNSAEEIKNADYHNIRFFTVNKAISVEPEYNCKGQWKECTSQTASEFSATAYFFGRELLKNIKVPVGLISTNWGGTNIESWISGEYIGKVDEYKSTVEKVAASKNDLIKKNEWILSHPVIDVSNRDTEHEWENLDFKDSACSEVNFNDAEWKVMNLPGNWENTEVGNFDGAVWFRKKIEIPKAWIGRELIAELGPIDDMDRTFINGKFIGGIEKIGYWDKPRVYNIPKEIITDSVLNIAIRVVDCGGGGGIFGNNVKMNIHPVNDSGFVPLSGGWKYLPVAEEYKYGKFYIYKIENSEFYSRPKTSVDIIENTPTVLYNGMIAPIIPYGIKGVIWYQGESNSSKAYSYKTLLPLMIENWRGNWGEGNFPFYYVQIAPFTYSQTEKSFIIRDAQFSTLSVPNTGMAVTLDIATVDNIHPPDKQDVGKRLALWALAKDYHKKVTYSGPLYKSMKIDKDKIELTFNYAGKGLVLKKVKDETNFIIAGKDKKFVKADVIIKGGKIIVSSPDVKEPAAVRYTWSNTEEATLFNSEMLPASTFRTDNWNE